ncbi:hypothetical protein L9F63_022701, partial [Diploptera punctata]
DHFMNVCIKQSFDHHIQLQSRSTEQSLRRLENRTDCVEDASTKKLNPSTM